MALSTGMDVGQVRGLAGQMSQAAGKLNQLSAQLGQQLQNTPWEGPDKNAFVSAWGDMDKQMKSASALLEETSAHLKTEAQQQEDASKS